mgnify:CR=1 FL=1
MRRRRILERRCHGRHCRIVAALFTVFVAGWLGLAAKQWHYRLTARHATVRKRLVRIFAAIEAALFRSPLIL